MEADPKISQASEPVCVFWDYEVHGWSDSGCRLVETNETYSICQCDHLTNFAILVKPQESVTTLRLDIIVCSVAAAILLFVLVAIYKVSSILQCLFMSLFLLNIHFWSELVFNSGYYQNLPKHVRILIYFWKYHKVAVASVILLFLG